MVYTYTMRNIRHFANVYSSLFKAAVDACRRPCHIHREFYINSRNTNGRYSGKVDFATSTGGSDEYSGVKVLVEVKRIGGPDGHHQLLSEIAAVRLLRVTNAGTDSIHTQFLELGHGSRGGINFMRCSVIGH
jgi:hypothetical protein